MPSQSSHATPGTPLVLSVNPRLDAAVHRGWPAWETAARAAGAAVVATWLAHRLQDPPFAVGIMETVDTLLTETDPDVLVDLRLELAEFFDEAEDGLAETLWEGVLAAATDASHGDAVAEASGRLAAIAEEHGDPLVAAEHFIGFLNWRRQPDHASDPEAIEHAFDEIIRLAQRDGDPRAEAIFSYRQASFTRLLTANDDRTLAGDWERDPAPYASWA